MMLAAISHDLRTPVDRMRLRAIHRDHDSRRACSGMFDEMQNMVDDSGLFLRRATAESRPLFDLRTFFEP